MVGDNDARGADKMLSKMLIRLAGQLLLVQLAACATMAETMLTGDESDTCASLLAPAVARSVDAGGNITKRNSAPGSSMDNEGDVSWHTVAFRIGLPEEGAVSWFMDVYLAHQLIKPVLEDYRHSIKLWRFHRRAVQDETGHQFSFIFYSSAGVAERIFDMIRINQQALVVNGTDDIDSVYYSDTENISRLQVEDTSDKSWSVAVQKTWPWFIMGVSEMWLRLINELASEELVRTDSEDYQEMMNTYASISDRLDRVWRFEGNHALLHHLNAMYGYSETIVTERKLTRF